MNDPLAYAALLSEIYLQRYGTTQERNQLRGGAEIAGSGAALLAARLPALLQPRVGQCADWHRTVLPAATSSQSAICSRTINAAATLFASSSPEWPRPAVAAGSQPGATVNLPIGDML